MHCKLWIRTKWAKIQEQLKIKQVKLNEIISQSLELIGEQKDKIGKFINKHNDAWQEVY